MEMSRLHRGTWVVLLVGTVFKATQRTRRFTRVAAATFSTERCRGACPLRGRAAGGSMEFHWTFQRFVSPPSRPPPILPVRLSRFTEVGAPALFHAFVPSRCSSFVWRKRTAPGPFLRARPTYWFYLLERPSLRIFRQIRRLAWDNVRSFGSRYGVGG